MWITLPTGWWLETPAGTNRRVIAIAMPPEGPPQLLTVSGIGKPEVVSSKHGRLDWGEDR